MQQRRLIHAVCDSLNKGVTFVRFAGVTILFVASCLALALKAISAINEIDSFVMLFCATVMVLVAAPHLRRL
jgi:hypothetical protein